MSGMHTVPISVSSIAEDPLSNVGRVLEAHKLILSSTTSLEPNIELAGSHSHPTGEKKVLFLQYILITVVCKRNCTFISVVHKSLTIPFPFTALLISLWHLLFYLHLLWILCLETLINHNVMCPRLILKINDSEWLNTVIATVVIHSQVNNILIMKGIKKNHSSSYKVLLVLYLK